MMVARMMVVPMSGWMKTSTIGMAAIVTTRTTSRSVISPCMSARIAASMPARMSRQTSDGLNWKPATWNQRCAPRALDPRGVRTSTSRMITVT